MPIEIRDSRLTQIVAADAAVEEAMSSLATPASSQAFRMFQVPSTLTSA